MATSQNGLPVLDSSRTGPLPRLRLWRIPNAGGAHLVLRDGSVGFLLAHFALWFDETVERLDLAGPWDEWGWAPRPIRGSTTISNHASGSAADLNATRHPLGVRGTYTKAQRRRLTWGLRVVYRGVLRHGEFYTRRVDGMHVETNKPFKVLERHARRLARTKRGRRILAANPGAREVIYS